MVEAVLSFGMVAVLLINEYSRFRGAFEATCKCLQITFWPLAHVNCKEKGIEKYHRFLKKTQTIAGKDFGSHDIFIQNEKKSHYAWNSAPIDDINVMRIVAAVGIEYRFTLDTELLLTPNLNIDNNQLLFKYLRDMSTN